MNLDQRVAELERIVRSLRIGKADIGNLDRLDLIEKSSTEATPPSGFGRMYAGLTAPWWVNDAGVLTGMFIDSMWMSGETAYPYDAGASASVGDTYFFPGITLDPTNTGSATWSTVFRASWAGRTLYSTAFWVSSSTNVGNVRLAVDVRQAQDGTNLSSGTSYLGTVSSVANPGQYVLEATNYTLGTLQSWTGGGMMMCGVRRDGGNAADTHTGTIRVLGLLLYVR